MNQTLSSSLKSPQSNDAIYETLTDFRKSIKQINPEANPYMIFENIKKWLNLQLLNLQDSEQAEYLNNIQTDIINKQDNIKDFEQLDNLDDLVINNLVLKLWKSPLISLSERMSEKSSNLPVIPPSPPSKGVNLQKKMGEKVPLSKRDLGGSETSQTTSEEAEKTEIVGIIKDAIENKKFKHKTDNLYALIYTILDLTKPSIKLLKDLLNLVENTENKILLSTQEGKQYLANLVRLNMIDNWREGALKDYFDQIENSLIKHDNSFWLLVTYDYILRHSLEGKNKDKLLIPFNCDQEKEVLLNLRLIIKDENNQFKIANKIYQQVFNENWLKETLRILVSKDETKNEIKNNLLNLIKSDNFSEIVKPLNNNQIFSNHVKSILKNTIYWTDGNQDLTRKILTFIEEAIVEYESKNIEWFNKNIIFSRLLGNEKYQITESDFSSLISRLVLTTEGLNDKNHINKNLIRLTTKFKRNPVLIADKILSITQDSKEIEIFVDDILSSKSIIKDEDDVDKITSDLLLTNNNEVLKSMPENNEKNKILENLTLDRLLDYIVMTSIGDIEGIILVYVADGLADYYNRPFINIKPESYDDILKPEEIKKYKDNLRDIDPKLYSELHKKLEEKEGRLEGLQSFDKIKDISLAFNEFGKEIGGSQLDYALFYMINPKRMLIASFTNIEGENYAIIYIGREAISMNRLTTKVEQTIPLIRTALEKDKDFL